MKAFTAVLPIVLVLSFLILGTSSPAAADAGVFTGNGQNLRQISSKSIQLVSIEVSIIPSFLEEDRSFSTAQYLLVSANHALPY